MSPNYPRAAGFTVSQGSAVAQIGLWVSLKQTWPKVWPLLILALVLRVLFLAIGAKIYYPGGQDSIYTNGDSYSYVLSFRNLLDYGRYTFDLTEPEAAVGRLPGYPLFYGLHYLVFGPKRVLIAASVTQALIDTSTVWLMYAITAQLAGPRSWAPLIAAVLLAVYPFSIVWTTITGTETLALFLVMLWWALLVLARPKAAKWLVLGGLLACIVYVREFLGACLMATLAYLFLSLRSQPLNLRWQPIAFVLAGFMALYIWWPVRNYVVLGRFIPLKPAAAGYANLREDAQAALAWVLTWTNDTNAGFDELEYATKPTFPAHVISTPEEKQLIDSLIVACRTCGSSFHVRMQVRAWVFHESDPPANLDPYYFPQYANVLRHNNCNQEITKGFIKLKANYIRRHPIRALLEVPGQNLWKTVFKSQLQWAGNEHTVVQRLTQLLFGYRSVLLILGLIGAWRYRRWQQLWPALLLAGIVYSYMAFVFRSLEMRYLLQVDVLLLLPASLLIAGWLPERWARSA